MASEIADKDEPERKRTTPGQFVGEVRAEARKVTWATRKEVQAATILVIIMAVLASLFFFVVDTVVGFLVKWILSL